MSKGGSGSKQYCFNANAWRAAVPIQVELSQVFRQKNETMVRVLNNLRLGVCGPAEEAVFRACSERVSLYRLNRKEPLQKHEEKQLGAWCNGHFDAYKACLKENDTPALRKKRREEA